MKIEDVLPGMRLGICARRKSQEKDGYEYCVKQTVCGHPQLFNRGALSHISMTDMLSDDWEIVEPPHCEATE